MSIPDAENLPPERASKTRFVVLGVLCLLSAVLYLDRICISRAAIPMQEELGLTNTQLSFMHMSFMLSYALFELPTGRWGDRIGPRRVLTRISLWWSAFTALTGACTGFWPLITVRFLFGAGEAGAFPNVARVMSRWFPDDERSRAQGLLLAASLMGGAAAPILADWLIRSVGWRWTFVVFGAVGVVWAIGFWLWFRDDPAAHPQVNDAEASRIGRRTTAGDVHAAIPWDLVLRNPSIWMLGGIMTLASFNSYIYFTWFPKYLVSGRGVDASLASTMSSVVLGASAIGTLFGGFLLDRLAIGRGDWRQRVFGGGAYFLAAVLIVAALLTPEAWPAVMLTAASSMLVMSTQSLWWSCAIGISGKHVGALFGLMNSAGVFGAMISQFLPGWIADWLGKYGYTGRPQWDAIFQINSGVLLVAAVVWASFRFVPVEDESDPSDSDILDEP